MPEVRPRDAPSLLVLARDISDAVRVGDLQTVAAAFALDPRTGLILGSGVAVSEVAARISLSERQLGRRFAELPRAALARS